MPFRFNPFTGNLDYYYDETGVNTGDVTLTTIGSTPNANGASLSGQQLQLQPADSSFGGVVSTTAQTFLGAKTLTTHNTASSNLVLQLIASQTANALNVKNTGGTNIMSVNISGRVFADIGSASNASYSFLNAGTSDSDTGVFSSGANSVSITTNSTERLRIGVSNSGYLNFGGNYTATTAGFTINSIASNVITLGLRLANGQSADILTVLNNAGTEIAEIDVNGYHRFPLGAVTTPTYSFYGDTNTGIYSSGADTVNITTGGNERTRFLSGGSVNIGANFTDTNATLQISTVAIGTVTQRIKAITSQTADLFQVVNTSNIPLVGVAISGNTYHGSNGIGIANTSHYFKSISTGNNTVVIHQLKSQTAPLLRYYDYLDAELAHVSIEGYHRLPYGNATTPALSFVSDTDLGLYRVDSDEIGITTDGTLKVAINKYGNIRTYGLHDNATYIGNPTDQEIRSGASFTPTFSKLTNVNSVSCEAVQWLRVGNVVTVSGWGDIDYNTGDVSFEMDLPVGSTFTAQKKCGGTACPYLTSTKLDAMLIRAVNGGSTVIFESYQQDSCSAGKFSFILTYEVQ